MSEFEIALEDAWSSYLEGKILIRRGAREIFEEGFAAGWAAIV